MLRVLGVLAVTLLAGSACSSAGSEEGSGTESVRVSVGGNSDKYINEHPGTVACKFFDGTIREGDRATLRGAGGEIVGVAELVASASTVDGLGNPNTVMVACNFDAIFSEVDTSHAAFTFELGSYGEVVASQAELLSDPMYVAVRDEFDALAGEKEPLKVDV